ncbi:uncharacterized protein si:dkey-3d4.3 [Trichomycterus rosablanca]|uniref:uncharacterized protein si:dkey-3d4.3 n=1 Tax=Trichomycterus rosablanca TaxID=2290929 RepID=UPI002F353409
MSSMTERNSPCLWISVPQVSTAPCNRYKHATCEYRGNVYLLGGRGKHSLKDFWKYNVVCNKWTKLYCKDDQAPDELEEHSMVAHQGILYVFGGWRDSVYTNSKTPFWLFDTDKEQWLHLNKPGSHSQKEVPANRKGHSAVVLGSSMYVYGGYIDMRGTLHEFWRFDTDTRMWSLLSNAQVCPGPRHSHSAMTHQDCMYLYGGLQGLKEQRDLWSWSCYNQTWSCINTFSGPSKLMGHSAVVYKDSMLLFGGAETQSAPRNCLWKLSLTTWTWEKLPSLPGSTAPCRIHHCSVGIGPSFQPGALEIPITNSKQKHRPFKNKCFPSSSSLQPEENIELKTLPMRKETDQKDITLASKWTEAKGGCLTFENQNAADEEWDDGRSSKETEDCVEHSLPDLLLIFGGKPLKEQAAISVWQMTLGDS